MYLCAEFETDGGFVKVEFWMLGHRQLFLIIIKMRIRSRSEDLDIEIVELCCNILA